MMVLIVLLVTPYCTKENPLPPHLPFPWPIQDLVVPVHAVPLQTPYPCCMTWGDISLPEGVFCVCEVEYLIKEHSLLQIDCVCPDRM